MSLFNKQLDFNKGDNSLFLFELDTGFRRHDKTYGNLLNRTLFTNNFILSLNLTEGVKKLRQELSIYLFG